MADPFKVDRTLCKSIGFEQFVRSDRFMDTIFNIHIKNELHGQMCPFVTNLIETSKFGKVEKRIVTSKNGQGWIYSTELFKPTLTIMQRQQMLDGYRNGHPFQSRNVYFSDSKKKIIICLLFIDRTGHYSAFMYKFLLS
jgi:hypothetical protein